MVLQKETRMGLTFGQMLSVLTIIGGIIIAWVSINVRVAQAEVRIQQLEVGHDRNARNIEVIRLENREDHKAIMDKLDEYFKSGAVK